LPQVLLHTPARDAAVVGTEAFTGVAHLTAVHLCMPQLRLSWWSAASMRDEDIGTAVVTGGIESGGTTTGAIGNCYIDISDAKPGQEWPGFFASCRCLARVDSRGPLTASFGGKRTLVMLFLDAALAPKRTEFCLLSDANHDKQHRISGVAELHASHV